MAPPHTRRYADYSLFKLRPVPNTNEPLPIRCPKCHYDGCLLVVKSLTVMTVTCVSCRHTWATDMQSLPAAVQERVPDAIDHLVK